MERNMVSYRQRESIVVECKIITTLFCVITIDTHCDFFLRTYNQHGTVKHSAVSGMPMMMSPKISDRLYCPSRLPLPMSKLNKCICRVSKAFFKKRLLWNSTLFNESLQCDKVCFIKKPTSETILEI